MSETITTAEKSEVDSRPTMVRTVLLGAQHLLAMYASIAATPLALAVALDVPQDQLIYLLTVTALMSGVATLIQSVGFWKIGAKLPLVQGTTFTAVAPMILIGSEWGWPAIFGSTIAAGLIALIIAPFFSRLLFLFPPVVTGTTIAAVGISLLPISLMWINGGDPTRETLSLPDLGLAGITILTILLVTKLSKGFLGRVAVMVGLVVGTIVAAVLGRLDLSPVGAAPWVEIVQPFEFGLPTFPISAVFAMTLVMIISMVETTSDVLAIGEITETKVDRKRIAAAIRADGLATALGGVFNAFPFTAYAQNVSLVQLTRIKSRWVIAAAGGLLVLIGLLPKVSAVVASIPMAVLGGGALVLFGGVAAVGIKILGKADLEDAGNLIIVAVSMGLAMMPVAMPTVFADLPSGVRIVAENSIVLACVTAIVLNVLFNVIGRGKGAGTKPAEETTPGSDVPSADGPSDEAHSPA